jgi:hypothetical protein
MNPRTPLASRRVDQRGSTFHITACRDCKRTLLRYNSSLEKRILARRSVRGEPLSSRSGFQSAARNRPFTKPSRHLDLATSPAV